MICPFCKEGHATSTLTPDSFATSTCMASSPGHYDERGGWVPGINPNTITQGYTCSRGHRYFVRSREGQRDEVLPVPARQPTEGRDDG